MSTALSALRARATPGVTVLLLCAAIVATLFVPVLAPVLIAAESNTAGSTDPRLLRLGERLFHEPALSRQGTQTCATCHDPARAFTDPREGRAGLAVSIGDDGVSHGDRNTPTLSYAAMSPVFHKDARGRYRGGQFWDGRVDDLRPQAGRPMLNPVEMAMPDKGTVIARLRDKADYRREFEAIFGAGVLDDADHGFDAATEALAAWQSSAFFSPFDSKYDRYLRGEEKLTAQEEFGRTVFITWNCRLCHMLQRQGVNTREPFTSFEFHNIGVPPNPRAREASGRGADFIDHGLLDRPGMDDRAQDGKFKIPTLRNVAVTGPYMHNGVFDELRTAVAFYNKYTSGRPAAQVNPETGQPWAAPEVGDTLSMPELKSGLALDDARIDALVAFLETLTDRRYEPLLEARKAERRARNSRSEAQGHDGSGP